jgi:hypothetical protein
MKICKGKAKLEIEVENLRAELNLLKEKSFLPPPPRKHLSTDVSIFGHESISHVSQDTLDTCWKRRAKGHIELIRHILKSPKNNNITRAEPEKPTSLLVFNGYTYVYTDKNDVYDIIYKSSSEILVKHHKQHMNRLQCKFQPSPSLFEAIDEYMACCDDDINRIEFRTNIEQELTLLFDKIKK